MGEGSRIANSTFEHCAYYDRLPDIANTTIGKFANIAPLTRIGPTDHPMDHASLRYRDRCLIAITARMGAAA